MLKVQFDGDVLLVRPDGPLMRGDVATLTRAACRPPRRLRAALRPRDDDCGRPLPTRQRLQPQ
jgi:hypothetical protein